MGPENRASNHLPNSLTFEIQYGLADILDTYQSTQNSFFAACRRYATDFSSQNYEMVEDTTYSLEFSLVDTIHAIAGRQRTAEAKLRLTQGFILADNTMRTNLFRELVPGAPFPAFAESESAFYLSRNTDAVLRQYGEAQSIASLASAAAASLKSDVLKLGEAVAVS